MSADRLKTRRRRAIVHAYLLPIAVGVWLLAIGFCLGLWVGADAATDAPVEDKPSAPIETVAHTPSPVVKARPIAFEGVVAESTPAYTEEELELLALVIYQEAGGDAASDECRQMVGEVALNRVADNRYPDTLAEVLTQYCQYGCLYWTGLVWPQRAELPQEAHAVARAYATAEALLSGTVERLLPEDAVFQSEYVQSTEILVYDSGLYFCR